MAASEKKAFYHLFHSRKMLGQRVVYTINVQTQVLLMSVSISISTLFFELLVEQAGFKVLFLFLFLLMFLIVFFVQNQMFYSVSLSCCAR